MAATKKVLTDIPGQAGGFWGDHTDVITAGRLGPALRRLLGDRLGRWAAGLVVGARLFLRQGRYPGVVTGGEAASSALALGQALFPWGRRPHVMIAQLYVPRSRAVFWWKRRQLALITRSVATVAVWASHEIEDYHRVYGIPREKIVYVPFHHTLKGYAFEVSEGDYVFSGGNYDRDYRTLVEAVRGLEVPVWIATTRPEQLAGVELPPNVRVEGTSDEGFRRALAGARVVVVAMAGGLLHSGGQQTLLNAMFMGKPVIAVGRKWAVDLIDHQVHGLAVDYEDPGGLREAIAWVLEHPEEAGQMARRGRERAQAFSTERTMETLFHLAGGGIDEGE